MTLDVARHWRVSRGAQQALLTAAVDEDIPAELDAMSLQCLLFGGES